MRVVREARIPDKVIYAGKVINQEGVATAIGNGQSFKIISSAFGSRIELSVECLGHEYTVMTTVTDGNIVKLVAVARTHKDPQIIRREDCVADSTVNLSTRQGRAVPLIVRLSSILHSFDHQCSKRKSQNPIIPLLRTWC